MPNPTRDFQPDFRRLTRKGNELAQICASRVISLRSTQRILGDHLPINFDRLGANKRDTATVPRDIFAAIPNKPWPRLRLEQGEVLKAWFARRTQRDIVIKQNTGGGKTVAGLLIAQSSLNEGVGPAAYLAPDTYLAAQVAKEADALGLPHTIDPKDEAFRASEAILITTFQRVVNGRSLFGVLGSGKRPVSLGTIIVDDAHSALSIAEKQFKVSIPREHAAYRQVLGLFEDALRDQNASSWRYIDTNQPGAPLRIPFWAWSQRQDDIRRILEQYADDPGEKWIYFAWPLVDQTLDLSVATVTAAELEIRPACSPMELIPSFANAHRRVYLTATLSDDGVLVTDLGAQPDDVGSPISPERAADLGDRLILAPLALNPSLEEDAIRQLVFEYSRGSRYGSTSAQDRINAVVLVPSDKRAALWKSYADLICHVGDLKDVVADLKAGKWLGVVVMVNKYDGVDLPGDACRLLVIDGVPFPLSPSEAREAAGLSGTETFAARQTQKIEQGMGRGIRDAEDHCAVLLMGSELALSIRSVKARQFYSPATRAQIELSQEVASQLQGEGLNAVSEALTFFLARAAGWLRASTAATAGVEYDQSGHVTEVSIARRRAFDYARAGQPHEAKQTLLDGIRKLAPYERGWFQEEAAGYADQFDHDEAQRILREARLANINVLLPTTAVPVRVVRPAAAQAIAASSVLQDLYDTGVELTLGIASILDSLTFDPTQVEAAEQGFSDLGTRLGFSTERPDKTYGTGPDVLWVINETSALLIELKSGVTREDGRIIKSELDQVSGHANWFEKNYPSGMKSTPLLVHPTATYVPNGTPLDGLRVLTPEALNALKERIRSFVKAVATHDGWKSPDVVRDQLTLNNLIGASSLMHVAVPAVPSFTYEQNPTTEKGQAPKPPVSEDGSTEPSKAVPTETGEATSSAGQDA